MEIKFDDGHRIKNFGKPYFVAELNTSHFGNIDIAKSMIDEAKSCGCNCVKFQSWNEDSLYSKSYYDSNPIAKRFVKKFSFSKEVLFELYEYCKSKDISFASTPYSFDEVDFLINVCDVPFIKVASMDLTSHFFLEYISKSKKPIVLSTGMADIIEIEKAISIIEKYGNSNICLLHCVSIYPPDNSILNLNNIIGLREKFKNYPVGYSDHSLGIEMASASVALGACIIEKHFTLDSQRIGMDNQMAIQPKEMKSLVNNCLNVHQALGSYERIVSELEVEQRLNMRRSLIAKKTLNPGEVIEQGDIDFKRPGTGIKPEKITEIVGKKVINKIERDTLIIKDDLSKK